MEPRIIQGYERLIFKTLRDFQYHTMGKWYHGILITNKVVQDF